MGRAKKRNTGTTSSTSACYSPKWHTHTDTVTPPHQPLQFAAKKVKGEVFHTHNWHLISQPKGWLAQRWLRLLSVPSSSQDHTVLTLTLSFLFFLYPSFLCSLSTSLVFFSSPVLLSSPSALPFSVFSLPPLSLSFFPSPLCTAPLCTAPVLPHSQRGITRQNAGSGEEREGREGGEEGTGRLPLCLQAISYSLGCRWNLIPTAFTCQVWLLASLIKYICKSFHLD